MYKKVRDFAKEIAPVIGAIAAFALLGAVVSLTTGCAMEKPKVDDLPASMSEIERKITYKWLNCMYAQQYQKTVDLRCNDILSAMEKVDVILIYKELEKEGKLPKIYRQSGSDVMTFDDYFKYIK